MKSLRIFIPIEPLPKERPRLGRFNNTYTPPKTSKYEKILKTYFQEVWGNDAPPMQGAIMADVCFYLTRPKSVPKKKEYPDTKPDLDNLEKSLFDALDFTFSDTNRKIARENKKINLLNEGMPKSQHKPLLPKIENGRIIDNDSRIVYKISQKVYYDTTDKTEPGIEIFLREISGLQISRGLTTPIAVVFTGNNHNVSLCQKLTSVLLTKKYLPIFLDIIEKEISEYTIETLKLTEGLCVVDTGKSDNDRLKETIEKAELLSKKVFKMKL